MYHRRIRQFILLLTDLLWGYLGLTVALTIRQGAFTSAEAFVRHAPLFTVVFAIGIVLSYIFGRYDTKHTSDIIPVVSATTCTFLLSSLYFYLFPTGGISPKTILFVTLLFSGIGSYATRIGDSLARRRTKKRSIGLITTETAPDIQELTAAIKASPDLTLDWISPTPSKDAIKTVDLIGISETKDTTADVLTLLYRHAVSYTQILPITDLYEQLLGKVSPSACTDVWCIHNISRVQRPYLHIRTMLDYTMGIILGIVTVLVFPFIAVAIRINSRGPILFSQERIGKGGVPFQLYKFRTMYALSPDGSAETGGAVFSKKGDARITPIGRFLRKTRLDELPQSWNLLRRDISLIGPRPERPEIVAALEQDAPYFSARTLIMPGITGWAAVKQHYTDTKASTIEKLQYDLYYIKHRSLLLDIKILLLTIRTVLHMKGQ